MPYAALNPFSISYFVFLTVKLARLLMPQGAGDYPDQESRFTSTAHKMAHERQRSYNQYNHLQLGFSFHDLIWPFPCNFDSDISFFLLHAIVCIDLCPDVSKNMCVVTCRRVMWTISYQNLSALWKWYTVWWEKRGIHAELLSQYRRNLPLQTYVISSIDN